MSLGRRDRESHVHCWSYRGLLRRVSSTLKWSEIPWIHSWDAVVEMLTKYGNYVAVGVVASLVNLAVFAVLLYHLPMLMASLFASVLAGAIAFTINYLTTFRGRTSRPIHHHAGLYAPIAAVSIGIAIITLWTLSSFFGTIASQGLGLVIGSVWGFAANRRWNFAVVPQ